MFNSNIRPNLIPLRDISAGHQTWLAGELVCQSAVHYVRQGPPSAETVGEGPLGGPVMREGLLGGPLVQASRLLAGPKGDCVPQSPIGLARNPSLVVLRHNSQLFVLLIIKTVLISSEKKVLRYGH